MPSAMPRNRENDPSVTISSGIWKRAINSAFSAPPAAPVRSAASVATARGKCQSCQAAPKTTAASPIMEPTERSMPPLIRTGVNAMASRPTSTLVRITSKKLPSVKKFCAMAEKIAISATRAANRPGRLSTAQDSVWSSPASHARARPNRIEAYGRQNDRTLNRFFPVRVDAQERKGRTDHAKQGHTQKRPGDGPSSSSDRSSADHYCGDHLHLQTESCVARDLIEADGIQQRRAARQRSRDREHAKCHQSRVDSNQPRGCFI